MDLQAKYGKIMQNRHITQRFGAELQSICREQDAELSSIVLVLNFQVMAFGIYASPKDSILVLVGSLLF